MKWTMVKLGAICRVIPGFAFKSADFTTIGIPVVKIANIRDDSTVDLSDAQCWPSHLFSERLQKFILKDKDIIVAMTGATAGKLGRVRTSQELLLNQRVAKIEPVEAEPDFIWCALSSRRYREQLYSIAGGAAQPNMSGGQIEAVEIPMPPRTAQQEIASILSAYDDLIENNRRRMALLEEAARQLYQEWFVRLRFPGHEHIHITEGVPQEWEQRTLGSCVTFLSGGTPSKSRSEYWGGEIPWISSGEITEPRLQDSTLRVTPEGVDQGSRLVPPNTILAVVRGMSLAKEFRIAVTSRVVAFNQDLKAFACNPDVTTEYLFSALVARRDEIRDRATEASHGTKKLDTPVLAAVQILLPTRQLQRQFCEIVQPMNSQWDNLWRQNRLLQRGRDLLLPRLMSGEIVV